MEQLFLLLENHSSYGKILLHLRPLTLSLGCIKENHQQFISQLMVTCDCL